jgi:hypothetical protein
MLVDCAGCALGGAATFSSGGGDDALATGAALLVGVALSIGTCSTCAGDAAPAAFCPQPLASVASVTKTNAHGARVVVTASRAP